MRLSEPYSFPHTQTLFGSRGEKSSEMFFIFLIYISQVWVPYGHTLNCWTEIIEWDQTICFLSATQWMVLMNKTRSIIDKIIGLFFFFFTNLNCKVIFHLTEQFIKAVINNFPLLKKTVIYQLTTVSLNKTVFTLPADWNRCSLSHTHRHTCFNCVSDYME